MTPLPPDAPLAMPEQSLRHKPVRARLSFSWRTALARLIAFGGTALIGSLGTWQMWLALGTEKSSSLQLVLLILFSLTFFWVAFSTCAALAGMLPLRKVPEALDLNGGKVALVMPVYGEDPAMTGASLLAMAQQLGVGRIAHRFEIFILSDTQHADAWLGETAAFAELQKASPIPVWYRRRALNIGRKSGNVESFIKRFGGRYDYIVMLDADSLMTARTLTALVARMDAAPNLGLLQTMPRLVGGESLLARSIQFAGALYGSIVARGVAAWQGDDGNYWGHNAIIRTRAFAECCGLPVLSGRTPIGGHILSHDFVEAALMRRAGWGVRMDPDLIGSYEGLPPTLDDLVQRERRWAQGNMQHLGVLFAKGLRWPSRVHFLIGIGSYIMSPIWLAMLVVGMSITAQTLFTKPQYFQSAYQLFPDWPTFDPVRMLWMFFAALTLLLLPKFAGWLRALLYPALRKRFGGAWVLTKGFVAELIISTLYAPLLMLIQTRHVIDIFLGRDSGWRTQNRAGALLPWRIALKNNLIYVVFAAVTLAALIWQAPNQIIWRSPIIAGLALSPWLSRHSGNIALGKKLARHNILLIPEEVKTPDILAKVEQDQALFQHARERTFRDMGRNRAHAAIHRQSLDANGDARPDARLLHITANAKLDAAEHYDEALSFLTAPEKLYISGQTALIDKLLELPD